MDGEITSLGLTWLGSIERLNWFSKDVMKFIPWGCWAGLMTYGVAPKSSGCPVRYMLFYV
jgi:hypothetical protein